MYIITVDNSGYYIWFPRIRSLDNKYFMFLLNEMKENIIVI